MGLSIVILAAGKGKRMGSSLPKVAHKVGGVAMIERVIATAKSLKPNSINVVYGNGGTRIRDDFKQLNVNWIQQHQQLGTGHAVAQALPNISDKDQVLILYGDVPLISTSTLTKLLEHSNNRRLSLVVTELDDPTGFGRIIRNEVSNIIAIVEHKDASEAQRRIKEINTGIITANAKDLKKWLPKLKNNNKQNEYYLTDIVGLAVGEGLSVGGVKAASRQEVQGVNDRWELARLERYYQLSKAQEIAYSGVTIMDPNRLDIRGNVKIGKDVTLDVNVILEGDVEIGSNVVIGPNVIIKDSIIGKDTHILANSVIEGAKIANECSVGPFARIRPETVLEKKAKIGNFVEVKKSKIGAGSKASHLAYVGDSVVGKEVNIGAGVITCNYDGVNKYKTVMDDGAFIGSNSSLVAPITVGKNAYIAAGSTVTKQAPANELTIARGKQMTIPGWKRPVKSKKK